MLHDQEWCCYRSHGFDTKYSDSSDVQQYISQSVEITDMSAMMKETGMEGEMSNKEPRGAADFASELREVGVKWYELGIFLDVNEGQLRHVDACHKHEGSNRCLIELYLLCTKMDMDLTWDKIAEALKKLDFHRLAKTIQTRSKGYGFTSIDHQVSNDIEMESTNPTPTQSVNIPSFVFELQESSGNSSLSSSSSFPLEQATPDHEATPDLETTPDHEATLDYEATPNHEEELVDDNEGEELGNQENILPYIEVNYDCSEKINDLFLHFSSLETDIIGVINRTIGVDKLQEFICSHFCIDKIPADKANNTRSVLHWLRNRCGHHEYLFFHKGLIKYQLDGNKSLTDKIKSYERHSKALQPTLSLGTMVTEGNPHTGPMAVEIKLNIKWARVTLKKFDLWLKEHFTTSYPDIKSMRVKRGCISISWLTDRTKDVEQDLRVESRAILTSYGVIKIRIGGKTKFMEPKNNEERDYPMIENMCDGDNTVIENNTDYMSHNEYCTDIKDIHHIA